MFSHKAWFEKDLPEVKYPVLADTAHTISRDYGVGIHRHQMDWRRLPGVSRRQDDARAKFTIPRELEFCAIG